MVPALLTRISIFPYTSTHLSIDAFAMSLSDKSACMNSILLFSFLIKLSISSQFVLERHGKKMSAPAFASATA
ncbi:hypothetical protein SDC9_88315 [bioreactor metagenome]|uniref:Uncharacterized protein n=1 Tax=bioreactor metagenome TaxID=1076179 RepID=A0A644ZL93_9ZZZZ